MANMHVFYEIAKHATAFPSNILAAEGGAHMFSIELASDCDNGASFLFAPICPTFAPLLSLLGLSEPAVLALPNATLSEAPQGV